MKREIVTWGKISINFLFSLRWLKRRKNGISKYEYQMKGIMIHSKQLQGVAS